jgi:hypothetical protein
MDNVLYIGETWIITGRALTRDKTPLDLSGGGTVEVRIASPEALVFRSQDGDITLNDPAGGAYTLRVNESDVRQSQIEPGVHRLEVVARTADDTVLVENDTTIELRMSLRRLYP